MLHVASSYLLDNDIVKYSSIYFFQVNIKLTKWPHINSYFSRKLSMQVALVNFYE